jgi:hypothetical protein
MLIVRRISVLVGATLLLSGCVSFEKIATNGQRAVGRHATKVLVDHRSELRQAADTSEKRGVLVFVGDDGSQLVAIMPGNSPLDAWLSYVAQNYKGKNIESLPMPSSKARVGAFIYKEGQYADNEIIYSTKLDEDVSRHYDISSAMSRLGSDLQDLRDITILLSRSDRTQNENIGKVKLSFDRLSTRFEGLQSQLRDIREGGQDANAELDSKITKILSNIEQIQRKLDEIR